MTRAALTILAILALGLVGCADDSGDATTGDGGSAGDGDGDSLDQGDFSLGITAMGDQQTFQVKVLEADPAPPQKFENDWVVQILDADGDPVEDVDLYEVEPFMPAHGHDGSFAPTIEPSSKPGSFSVTRINLWMGGDWEVRFFARQGDGTDALEDRVVIDVFIED